jgi:hypothetical protein
MKIAGSRSESGFISQRRGSTDPDPHQNVMDPQHCFLLFPKYCGKFFYTFLYIKFRHVIQVFRSDADLTPLTIVTRHITGTAPTSEPVVCVWRAILIAGIERTPHFFDPVWQLATRLFFIWLRVKARLSYVC